MFVLSVVPAVAAPATVGRWHRLISVVRLRLEIVFSVGGLSTITAKNYIKKMYG